MERPNKSIFSKIFTSKSSSNSETRASYPAKVGGTIPAFPGKSGRLVGKGIRDNLNKIIAQYNESTDEVERKKLLADIKQLKDEWINKIKQQRAKEKKKSKPDNEKLAYLKDKKNKIKPYEGVISNELSRLDGRRIQESVDGVPYTDNTKLDNLRQFIQTVRGYISRGEYQEAHNLLTDKETNDAAFDINLQMKRAAIRGGFDSLEASKINRFYGDKNNQIDLAVIYEPNLFTNGAKAATAREVCLMALEEYMHLYQAKSNSFLSNSTGEFRKTGLRQDAAIVSGKADYDEIDVYAAFREWGLLDGIEYFSSYDERIAYAKWLESQ